MVTRNCDGSRTFIIGACHFVRRRRMGGEEECVYVCNFHRVWVENGKQSKKRWHKLVCVDGNTTTRIMQVASLFGLERLLYPSCLQTLEVHNHRQQMAVLACQAHVSQKTSGILVTIKRQILSQSFRWLIHGRNNRGQLLGGLYFNYMSWCNCACMQ